MAGQLRGPGKNAPGLRFTRTELRHEVPGRVTVIPLDQIDRVEVGKQPGNPLFMVLGVVLMAGGGLAYWYIISLVGFILLLAGVALGLGALAAYFLMRPNLVRVDSAHGEIAFHFPKLAEKAARAFVDDLMRARTDFLEGVYGEEA